MNVAKYSGMGILGGKLGKWLLAPVLVPPARVDSELAAYASSLGEISAYFDLHKESFKDRTVMDFGCGYGRAVIEVAQLGARRVIGLDIRDHVLAEGRERARQHNLRNCLFVNATRPEATTLHHTVDVILSIDAFEHYAQPATILDEMDRYLAPNGVIYLSFGPPWWHPYGPHLQFMTRLPWPHILFPERVLMAARAQYKDDHAQRFEEVEGGLNRMSIRRFERLIEASAFRIHTLHLIPIRRTSLVHRYLPGGRELFTSVVKACLTRKAA